ncbi:MAG TPA: pyrimidine 5'-nucleotidase [Rhizomicrobium sp.]|jgi:putative hydrolase of the HAD superfamily|nr:pyrimidine 5'-nucleotidase [Rhizomicrobium sp.]
MHARLADTAPDMRHVDTWIFDLDNTLYRADSDLFAQIDARMASYVAALLSVPLDEARRIQKDYYRDHGTTLNGLMKVHDADPEPFLAQAHDIDLSVLVPDPGLNKSIASLPGRRFVLTNGCRNYAGRVLERIGLGSLFDDVWDIRAMGYRPKPDPAAYRTLIARNAIEPQRAALFEDLARNLVPARELGMTTVWLNNGSVWSKQGPEHPIAESHHIDHETRDLAEFLRSIRI